MITTRIMKAAPRLHCLCRIATLMFALLALSVFASAQQFTVLHNFSGGGDGAYPYAGVTLDAAGGLYGTTTQGGVSGACNGCGTIYKLAHRGSGWVLTTLYTFHGQDGANPQSRVTFGPGGALFGTTDSGGQLYGTVFKLQPPSSICPSVACAWSLTTLHSFTNDPDGARPAAADLAFDSAGNIYGATNTGGNTGFVCADDEPCGAVYKMTRSGNTWTESVVYNFQGESDGAFPNGVTLDSAGNLFGTTIFRGDQVEGTVFVLTPNGHGGFTEESLYSFSGGLDGAEPWGTAILDGSGGYFGTTSWGGSGNGGTVWHLHSSGGNWTLDTLASFSYSGQLDVPPPGSTAALTMDAAGNLYGTTRLDGAFSQGSVFKLTHSGSGWTLTTLHDFTGAADGGQPFGQVSIDANGNLFGTASIGGNTVGTPSCYRGLGCGVVWEIAQ